MQRQSTEGTCCQETFPASLKHCLLKKVTSKILSNVRRTGGVALSRYTESSVNEVNVLTMLFWHSPLNWLNFLLVRRFALPIAARNFPFTANQTHTASDNLPKTETSAVIKSKQRVFFLLKMIKFRHSLTRPRFLSVRELEMAALYLLQFFGLDTSTFV